MMLQTKYNPWMLKSYIMLNVMQTGNHGSQTYGQTLLEIESISQDFKSSMPTKPHCNPTLFLCSFHRHCLKYVPGPTLLADRKPWLNLSVILYQLNQFVLKPKCFVKAQELTALSVFIFFKTHRPSNMLQCLSYLAIWELNHIEVHRIEYRVF